MPTVTIISPERPNPMPGGPPLRGFWSQGRCFEVGTHEVDLPAAVVAAMEVEIAAGESPLTITRPDGHVTSSPADLGRWVRPVETDTRRRFR